MTIYVMPRTFEFDATPIALGSLALFNDSKTRRLNLVNNDPLSEGLPYQTLLPVENLHALTFSQCRTRPSSALWTPA